MTPHNPYTTARDEALALIASGVADIRNTSAAWMLGVAHFAIARGLSQLAALADDGEEFSVSIDSATVDADVMIMSRVPDADEAFWAEADYRYETARDAESGK